MEDPIDLPGLLSRAASALQESSGCPLVLSDPVVLKNWRRSLVLRCRMEPSGAGSSSRIIRQIKEEPERGFSDWASLAFLSGLPAVRSLVPRFHGGDPGNHVYVMEDLGEGTSLEGILAGGDQGELLAGLRVLARLMARLHCATQGGEDSFDALRSSLPGGGALGREMEAEKWLGNRERIVAWFEALNCEPPRGFEESLASIAAIYAEADGFLAFTHGDPAPSNNHFGPAGPRLLDFEYGGFRHALYDITAWNVLCPLPLELVGEMRRSFREELVIGFPAARDEARFDHAWACLCAYRAWAILTWIPLDVLRANRPWADHWGMREAVFVALSRMAECCGDIAGLAASGDAARGLLKAMRERWPDFDDPEELLPKWGAREPSHPA